MRVLDLGHYVAGPFCTKFLADYGADVIKVEKPGEGDEARKAGPFLNDIPDPETSGLFLHLNTNKRGITLNLKTEAGKAILKELVKWADILVENFRPRVMPSLGLSYEVMEKLNPRLVMTSITNFGQTGPYRDYEAWDVVEYALGGLMYFVGETDREPLKGPNFQAQYLGGVFAAVGTMGAYHYQQLTGLGQYQDVSIHDCVSSVLENVLTSYIYDGTIRPRVGSRRVSSHPFGILPCKDGAIGIAIGVPTQWQALARLTGNPDKAEDPEWGLARWRGLNYEKVNAALAPYLMSHTQEELFHTGQQWRIPTNPVPNVAQVIALPHNKAREVFMEVEHPRTGPRVYTGAPFRLRETPWSIRRPAPLLGQHNEEVLCGMLGYSKQDLVKLSDRGVI
jgi:crotonobetainyl-CoA:carnitine CoA-transferase CaiB-like acyl-CoA transferase